jgi:uncharacterized protein (TIGR03905 family)
MTYQYKTKGVCARGISFDLEGGVVRSVRFDGGCGGNTVGIAKLVDGMKAEDVIARCKGIPCGFKATSCPDQLARALEEAVRQG